MLTSKQRAFLRSLASKENPVVQIGKDSVTPELVKSVDEVLEKRELIKANILNNCLDDPKYIAEVIASRTHSEVVQIIGHKIVFYRESKKKPIIELPK